MAVMAEEVIRQYRQKIVVDPRHFACFRRTIAAVVDLWGWGEILTPALMCVTELLTNVHQHVGSNCVLLLEATPHGVRITVSDSSRELPKVHQPDWYYESGRGMWLVSHTAHDWGSKVTPAGKDVWVELRSSAEQFAA